MESPESWFEDFGSGQLDGGSATVQLDPTFAGLVDTGDYHVFLTPRGDAGLYLSNQTAGAGSPSASSAPARAAPVRNRAAGGGTSGIRLQLSRTVAKRRDITGARLEHAGEPAGGTAADACQLRACGVAVADWETGFAPGHGGSGH